MFTQELSELKRRMDGALDALKQEFGGLRTGRASVSLLDPVMVDAYGTSTPISQVGTVTVPEPRMIAVQVWDQGMVPAVEKAIRDAGLGLNPIGDKNLVRVPMPDLNEERRKELTKIAGKYAEQSRISIRNIRRDGMEQVKKLEKDSGLSQDEARKASQEVQDVTDSHIKKVDVMLAEKEKDILSI